MRLYSVYLKKMIKAVLFFLLCIPVYTVWAQGPPDIIGTITPNSANPGDMNVSVTITLVDPGTDPGIPPSDPTSAFIGDIEVNAGTLVRDNYDVTAEFDFPVSETEGYKDVSLVFPGPENDVTFTETSGFLVGTASTEQTTGLFINEAAAYDGYTLFAPMMSTTTYLMDMDGDFVYTWDSAYQPGLAAYLLEDGILLRAGTTQNSLFTAGGSGGIVEMIDKDSNVVWSYTLSDSLNCLHHDIEYLPNGNVLMIAWEMKTQSEALAMGRDSDLLSEGELWPDMIIEVDPDTDDIVWEWHAWDHLIQDHDDTITETYGDVSAHPELIDLNYTNTPSGNADWLHINSVEYIEEFDQVLLSVHNFSEIWVIDHSTTTAEAAAHSGGNYGKGGDLLYRWGNPIAYGAGTTNDQKLFAQHDATWLPDDNHILIFNNGMKRPDGDYSSVEEIAPPVDGSGNYTDPSAGSAYDPSSAYWTYTDPAEPTDFFSSNISGALRLPNGNTLICEGATGTFFEIDTSDQTVWKYVNPVTSSGILGTTDPIPVDNQGNQTNQVFKIKRYAPDYPGLADYVTPETVTVTYPIVDTDQATCYDENASIPCPGSDAAFYGQDAQFDGYQPSYTVSEDGLTVYDNITGLTWMKSPDLNGDGEIDSDDKLTYSEAQSYPDTLNARNFGGYNDWRAPTIKELYSLMNFTGTEPTSDDVSGIDPFIDADYFDFAYGDTSAEERVIDSQWVTCTTYTATNKMFGVNFADGRIKGYGYGVVNPQMEEKTFYVRLCRGNTDYGKNDFKDNGDGTITDNATGLMWSQDDSGNGVDTGPRSGMLWEDAFVWVQEKNAENYLGYNDWRLPNAKEMQSIIDYSRSPDATGSAAIDPMFNITQITNEAGEIDYPWYWTGTTHKRQNYGQINAVYICFGRALGYMNGSWQDVHGAGAQRSDVKTGDFTHLTYVSDGYYFDQSPQGDAVRSYNYVRLVRDVETTSAEIYTIGHAINLLRLLAGYSGGSPYDIDGDGVTTPADVLFVIQYLAGFQRTG